MKKCELAVAAGIAAVFGYAIYSAKGLPGLNFALPFAVTSSCSGVAEQPGQCYAPQPMAIEGGFYTRGPGERVAYEQYGMRPGWTTGPVGLSPVGYLPVSGVPTIVKPTYPWKKGPWKQILPTNPWIAYR